MLGEQLDAASAGYRVGYDNTSHFNQEYEKLFDALPLHVMEQLRQTARQDDGLGAAWEPLIGPDSLLLWAGPHLNSSAYHVNKPSKR